MGMSYLVGVKVWKFSKRDSCGLGDLVNSLSSFLGNYLLKAKNVFVPGVAVPEDSIGLKPLDTVL
jgi:hypothetical protein